MRFFHRHHDFLVSSHPKDAFLSLIDWCPSHLLLLVHRSQHHMSAAQWARVAEGLRLVLSAAAVQTSERSAVIATVAKHGMEVAANTHKSVVAAGLQRSYVAPLASELNFSIEKVALKSTPSYQPSESTNANGLHSPAPTTTGTVACSIDNSQALLSVSMITGRGKVDFTTEQKIKPINGIDQFKEKKVNDANDGDYVVAEVVDPTDTNNAVDAVVEPTQSQQPTEAYAFDPKEDLPVIRQGTAVPSTQLSRALGFASLGIGLMAGTIAEATSRFIDSRRNQNNDSSQEQTGTSPAVASDANAQRLASSLARLRGAALKLGQMLSIQDETVFSPTLAKALRQVVHQGADSMPPDQLYHQLSTELGKDWKDKFVTFDEHPMAAASIGQVHRASIRHDNSSSDTTNKTVRNVVVKVQYPGVAESIESDLANLNMLVKATGLAPPGLFIDEIIRVGRKEVLVECDYEREMANQVRFRQLVKEDDALREAKFVVPCVIKELTTKRVLTTEFVPGGTIDKVANLSQAERNRIGRAIMTLAMRELFQWRFMQTDPK